MTQPARWALLAASGSSRRMGYDKLYTRIHDKLLIQHSVDLFLGHQEFDGVLVTQTRNNKLPFADPKLLCCEGGSSRANSVLLGLEFLTKMHKENIQVWVHDAARPCLNKNTLDEIIRACDEADSPAIVARRVSDSIKRVGCTTQTQPLVEEHCDRDYYWQAQTPQIAMLDQLLSAYRYCVERGIEVTDEATALGAIGLQVRLLACPAPNPKVTFAEDLLLAQQLLG